MLSQAGLELPTLGDTPALAFRGAGITGVSQPHVASTFDELLSWPNPMHLPMHLVLKARNVFVFINKTQKAL